MEKEVVSVTIDMDSSMEDISLDEHDDRNIRSPTCQTSLQEPIQPTSPTPSPPSSLADSTFPSAFPAAFPDGANSSERQGARSLNALLESYGYSATKSQEKTKEVKLVEQSENSKESDASLVETESSSSYG